MIDRRTAAGVLLAIVAMLLMVAAVAPLLK